MAEKIARIDIGYMGESVTKCKWLELSEGCRMDIARLWHLVWPTESDSPDSLLEKMDALRKGGEFADETIHARMTPDGQVLAVGRSFGTRVRFADKEDEFQLMALASVCCHPDWRGMGIGGSIVKDAFSRVDSGEFALALFQTCVPDFYMRSGAKIVHNSFVDSTNAEVPDASPWWNPHVMVYPLVCEWREGTVDLLGPGY